MRKGVEIEETNRHLEKKKLIHKIQSGLIGKEIKMGTSGDQIKIKKVLLKFSW